MKKTAESFSCVCIKAYECWQMYKIMREYKIDDKSGIWGRFEPILQHYCFLQVAKINDRAKQGRNLSLEYYVSLVNKPSFTNSYKKFLSDNNEFIEAIRKARNKVIAHPDLKVYTSHELVGAFSEGLDEKYFDSLHKIISQGYSELGLGPFPEWPPFIEGDTKTFMNKISEIFNTSQLK